jgi:DNA-binding NtrC family response regulator
MTADEGERLLIEATLKRLRNNKTHAAIQLGISTKTLHAKLRKYRREAAANPEEGSAEQAGAHAGSV